MLTLDQISAAPDLPLQTVAVPEWGGEVSLRTLTAAERDDWESAMIQRRDKDSDELNYQNLKSDLVARTLANADGTPLFDDISSGIKLLAKKSGAVLSRLFDVAQRLNGLTNKDVEELAKNSAAAQSGSSSTTSPTASDSVASAS